MQFWPPSSPNLTVLDYAIFARLQEHVLKRPYNSVDALLKEMKLRLKAMKTEWVKMGKVSQQGIGSYWCERGLLHNVTSYRVA